MSEKRALYFTPSEKMMGFNIEKFRDEYVDVLYSLGFELESNTTCFGWVRELYEGLSFIVEENPYYMGFRHPKPYRSHPLRARLHGGVDYIENAPERALEELLDELKEPLELEASFYGRL